ncbi:MAG: C-type lectin domain-containing protein, partial [Pseudomonadota bacterium]
PGHEVLARRDVGGVSYLVVKAPEPLRWDEALEASQQFGGLLASIADAAEASEILVALRRAPGAFRRIPIPLKRVYVGPWIGGFQKSDGQEPDGGWTWIDGAPWSYENWAEGEPNNLGFKEDYALIYCERAPLCVEWNDADSSLLRSASYVVKVRR